MAAIDYTAPPTCARFMVSEAFIRLIAGPVGSGKTTACILELFRRAAAQHPAPDGYRYTRFAVLRQTLQQLKMTVLKDVLQWLRGFSVWKVSENTIFVEVGDIKSEWIFLPMEDPEDQRRLLSSQLTGAWISECIEIDSDLVSAIAGRCGRYPGAAMGGCTHSFVIMDTNMPEEGSSWHKLMETPPPDWDVFFQPGGLSEGAENLPFLNQTVETLKLPPEDPRRIAQGRTYYERLAGNSVPAYVDRYVHAKYGIDPSGRAVFGAIFHEKTEHGFPWHVQDELTPVYGAPLIIGQDFGRDPCCVLMQVDNTGRLNVLEEVISRHMGLEKHIDTALRPLLMTKRYLGLPVIIVGDPSGVARNNLFEITSFEFLKQRGFFAVPASTNDIDPRLRAVEGWLLGARGTGPAMVFDRQRCPTLILAMKSGYRFENVKSGNPTMKGETKATPLKNEYSHVIDGLQYGCLGAQQGPLAYAQRVLMRPAHRVGQVQQLNAGGWT
jgi:hypothetical protein